MAPAELDDLLVIDVARRRDDDVRACVVGAVIGVDVRDRDRADHLGLAEHPPAERMAAEDRAVEHVVDLVLRLVLVHRDLLEHDLALGVDLGIGRAEQHLRQQVEGLVGVGVEEPRVEVRRLLAGSRVHRGAEAVEDLRDLDRRVALRALEEQVLQEMRDAGLRRRLVPRACANPEPQGHGSHRGHRLGDDPDPGVELGYLRFGPRGRA